MYLNAEEKLEAEEEKLLESVKPEFKKIMRAQYDAIFEELLKRVKEEPDFAEKVLSEKKSFEKAMKYAAEQVMKIREPSDEEKKKARNRETPITTPVSIEYVLQWIYEYYDLEEKEEPVKKEKETSAKPADEVAKAEPKPIVKHAKKKKGDMDGQLSLFGF